MDDSINSPPWTMRLGQGRPGADPEEAGRAGAQGACGLASACAGGRVCGGGSWRGRPKIMVVSLWKMVKNCGFTPNIGIQWETNGKKGAWAMKLMVNFWAFDYGNWWCSEQVGMMSANNNKPRICWFNLYQPFMVKLGWVYNYFTTKIWLKLDYIQFRSQLNNH